MYLPDLSGFSPHRVVDDTDLDGVIVPGLRATFHRRPAGDTIESVGVYSFRGEEIFMAWGYVGEEHCRWTALRGPDGTWGAPAPGCPPVGTYWDGGRATALTVGDHVLPMDLSGPPAADPFGSVPDVPPPTTEDNQPMPRDWQVSAADSGVHSGALTPEVVDS
ncbi:hypothetical protein [Catenuloplanes japonicus]|uniref:hypothetical protein n=1 Tax=Catenuloplanes japonicus TaxID=33876 RepID=UPI0005241B4E|nr:hypothetical protein [Catenuloplanes japonicus]